MKTGIGWSVAIRSHSAPTHRDILDAKFIYAAVRDILFIRAVRNVAEVCGELPEGEPQTIMFSC